MGSKSYPGLSLDSGSLPREVAWCVYYFGALKQARQSCHGVALYILRHIERGITSAVIVE